MKNAIKDLAVRAPDFGIIFISNYAPSQKIKDVVANGDFVKLKIEDEQILVRDVVESSTGQYRGVIYGFEPTAVLEYKGLKLEQEIEFNERHIFGCSDA